MNKQIFSRTSPLTNGQIDEFFADHGHLAYRHTMLLAHMEKDRKEELQNHYELAICAFEASLLTCRMFMTFLGLGITRQPKLSLIEKREYFEIGGKTDEVKVIDLGGQFVNLVDLAQSERDLLARVYNAASKATAHFTYGSKPDPDPNDLHPAATLVDKLLRKNLYDIVNKPVKLHGL